MITDTAGQQYRRLTQEPALDGIRGIAVLTVTAWHYSSDILQQPLEFFKAGHLGVDLFFVLSGFLITSLLLNEYQRNGRISFSGFYRRRAFRLLPAILVFLPVHFIWAALNDVPAGPLTGGTEMRNEIASVLTALFFSINILTLLGDFTATVGIGHLWSLAVEEQFYFIWPLLMVTLLRTGRRPFLGSAGITALLVVFSGHFLVWDGLAALPRMGVSLTVGVAVLALLAAGQRLPLDLRPLPTLAILVVAVLLFRNGLFDGSPHSRMLLYGMLPSRADSLIVGAMLAILWVSGRVPHRCPTGFAIAGWIVLGWMVARVSLQDDFFFGAGWTLSALCGALILWGALGSQGTLYGRILTMPWLRAIGKVAYGLYIWHVFVFVVVKYGFPDESLLVRTVLALSITAAVTTASWFLVERPMLAYKSAPGVPGDAGKATS